MKTTIEQQAAELAKVASETDNLWRAGTPILSWSKTVAAAIQPLLEKMLAEAVKPVDVAKIAEGLAKHLCRDAVTKKHYYDGFFQGETESLCGDITAYLSTYPNFSPASPAKPDAIAEKLADPFVISVQRELDHAYAKHGRDPWGRHEFYAVLKEEVDELWDAIKQDDPMQAVIEEVRQIACVCKRYAETGDRHRGPHPIVPARDAPISAKSAHEAAELAKKGGDK